MTPAPAFCAALLTLLALPCQPREMSLSLPRPVLLKLHALGIPTGGTILRRQPRSNVLCREAVREAVHLPGLTPVSVLCQHILEPAVPGTIGALQLVCALDRISCRPPKEGHCKLFRVIHVALERVAVEADLFHGR